MLPKITPKESISAILSRYGDVFYRVLSIVISASILFGVTWLRSEFVSQDRYSIDQRKQNDMITKISDTLIRMEKKDLVDASQTETLRDHESRMRIIERDRYSLKASYRIANDNERKTDIHDLD